MWLAVGHACESYGRCTPRGELYGLRWGDFDADSKSVTIKRANIARRMVETKTDAGERVVPVFASVRRAVLEHKLRSSFSGDDDLVFPDPLAGPFTPARR